MDEIDTTTWRGTADYTHFYNGFIKKPGSHLLCVGMTGAGKTMKALVLAKWCLEAGKAVCWFDTLKPDDLNYLLNIESLERVNVFTPQGCTIHIENARPEIIYHEIGNPSTLFRDVQKGLNIISLYPFFDDTPPYVMYLSKVMHGMINDAFRKRLKVGPIQIFLDEFQDVAPAKRIHHNKNQQELAARIAMALFKLRSIGVGLTAFTQSYRNVFLATKMQFSYYLICKDPDGDPNDYIGKKLLKFSNLFAGFTPEMAVLIHPNGKWEDIIRWPMPVKDDKINIDYLGIITKQEGDSIVMRIPRDMAGPVKEFIATTRSAPLQSPSGPLSISQDHK